MHTAPKNGLSVEKWYGSQGKAGFLGLSSNSNCNCCCRCSLWLYLVLQSAPCRCLASGAVQPRTCWLSASSNPSPNCFILLLQGGLSSVIAQVCSCIVLSVPMEAAKPQSLPVPSAYQSLGIQADFAPEGREHLDKEARTCSLLPHSVSLPTR